MPTIDERCYGHEPASSELRALRAEVERLDCARCIYCGWEHRGEESDERLRVHISECEVHPLRVAERERDEAREALRYVIDVREIKCQHKHPPPDECCARCRADKALTGGRNEQCVDSKICCECDEVHTERGCCLHEATGGRESCCSIGAHADTCTATRAGAKT